MSVYRFCAKHNIANPCPVCMDRAAIRWLYTLVSIVAIADAPDDLREAIERAQRERPS